MHTTKRTFTLSLSLRPPEFPASTGKASAAPAPATSSPWTRGAGCAWSRGRPESPEPPELSRVRDSRRAAGPTFSLRPPRRLSLPTLFGQPVLLSHNRTADAAAPAPAPHRRVRRGKRASRLGPHGIQAKSPCPAAPGRRAVRLPRPVLTTDLVTPKIREEG